MRTLALDTSTLTGSVAVLDGQTLLAELCCRVRANHSEHLLERVRDALSMASITLAEVERVAVGVGPGSFTGVRIGMSTAKGLALGAGVSLVGVSSLAALAASVSCVEGVVVAALDARRGEVYATAGRFDEGRWTPLLDGLAGTPEAVGAVLAEREIGARAVLVGDLADAVADRLASAAGASLRRAAGLGHPLARFVGLLADGEHAIADTGAMEPLYLRGADAKLPMDRGGLRAEPAALVPAETPPIPPGGKAAS